MMKQIILVLNRTGVKLAQENIKDILGPKWAWKIGKLTQAVWFVEGDWQDKELREAIADHNFKVQVRWLSGGGDPPRKFWWHVTEVTLDHLRPSPRWKKEMAELQLAKDCEAAIRKGLRDLAERRKRRRKNIKCCSKRSKTLKTNSSQTRFKILGKPVCMKRESQGGGRSFAPGDGASQAKHRLCSGSGRESHNGFD